jgi:arginine decarboxylase
MPIPLAQVMPELVEEHPDTYANMGIHDLGDSMFAWLKENNPGRLNAAYSGSAGCGYYSA